jgi:hypothetical protein
VTKDPIPLRAHSALCLLGYRGEGYSAAFVERMDEVSAAVSADPSQRVRLLASPDTLCAACPHLRGGCTLSGPEHEAHMRAQDETVLRRLGLEAGVVLAWQDVRRKIRAAVRGADLPGICTTCPWLPLGWCAAGVDALRSEPEV